MPTKKRITVPGVIAHIMARGINGADIFKDDDGRRYFLTLFADSLAKTDYHCYGWTLMSNHYHAVVRCSEQPLEKLVRTMNSKYAKYFNTRHGRSGYLFQDRFKSLLSQDQRYLEELIRYVHLNPVRAGICTSMDELERYPWSGHSVLMGTQRCPFQTTEPVLRRFALEEAEARRLYRIFVEKGLTTVGEDRIVEVVRASNRGKERGRHPGCWVIGEQEYVGSVLKKHEDRLRSISILRQRWSLDAIAKVVAREDGMQPQDLQVLSKAVALVSLRKKFSYIGCAIVGYPVAHVARYLHQSGPAVSWQVKAGKELVSKEIIELFCILPPG